MEAILDRGRPLYLRSAVAGRERAGRASGCWRSPAPTARRRPRRCWRGFSRTAGKAPGFLIGGVPQNFGVSARWTAGPLFVIEADEYDTAFFDKRSKFVHYRPRTAILNNLEFDHADIFADLAAIETQFHHLVRTVPGSGLHRRQRHAMRRWTGCWRAAAGRPVERFGGAAGWQARAGRRGSPSTSCMPASVVGRVRWDLLGEHNRANALAAIAAARHAGVPPGAAIAALGRFENVKRRMEVRGVGARRHGVRRLRPPSDRDRDHRGRTAQQGRRRAHPRGARAALQHHEARRDEGRRCPAACRTPTGCSATRGGLGWDAREALAPLGDRRAGRGRPRSPGRGDRGRSARPAIMCW